MTDNPLVDVIAKAIYDDHNGWLRPDYSFTAEDFEDTATAALRAIEDAGWKVVKKEEG